VKFRGKTRQGTLEVRVVKKGIVPRCVVIYISFLENNTNLN